MLKNWSLRHHTDRYKYKYYKIANENRNIKQWNEIPIIQTVEHNRREDVALQRGGRNALTISGQQAYHNRPIALVSHQGRYVCVDSYLFGSSRTSNHRNKYAIMRYSWQYARLHSTMY